LNAWAVFDISGDAYDRFMGRYSRRLAPLFVEFAGVDGDAHVLDVGCGPGALTAELVDRLGPDRVAAVDPSSSFVAAIRERLPGVSVQQAQAEELPLPDASVDAALSQLVVAFIDDAPRAARELHRVLRPNGTAAFCMWDGGGAMQLFGVVWGALHAVDPTLPEEGRRLGYRDPDSLRGLLQGAEFADVKTAPLDVEGAYADFEDFWNALQMRAGPVGDAVGRLDAAQLEALRAECRARLGDPEGAFTLSARAWAVRGRRPEQ
jgi:SAM-dependent methyltransferase